MTKNFLKLSAPKTHQFWKVPVLYEDAQLLALDKPPQLLSSPDRYDPERPNLMKLLHRDIERGVPWAFSRQLSYLMNAHRLDYETSGVILLAKDKETLVQLAAQFGTQKPVKVYAALVRGQPAEKELTISAPLAAHPLNPALIRVDEKRGKAAVTKIRVLEQFRRFAFLECQPLTGRTHQIRAHLRWMKLPLVGDSTYGGNPLFLSTLKPDYRLKAHDVERPLMGRSALHALRLSLVHPATGNEVTIESPMPKEFAVSIKYLQRYAPFGAGYGSADAEGEDTDMQADPS